MGKIMGLGSSNVDITDYVPHLPQPGESVIGSMSRIGPGGKALNQMTAARLAGSEVTFLSRVGRDALAAVVLDHLRACGISTEYIDAPEGMQTSNALIEIDTTTAQNCIAVVPTASMSLTAADVRRAESAFAAADLVVVPFESSQESIVEAGRLARKYGKFFLVNPAPYREMPADFYRGVDLVTPNETEAEQLTGVRIDSVEAAERAARKLLDMGVGQVVVTLGKRGMLYLGGRDAEPWHLPSIERLRAVDTTGAGDAFNGGLAAAIAEGRSMREALCFANCTAGISVTRRGAAEAMPTRAETMQVMREEYGITF